MKQQTLVTIESELARRNMLKHPFYQAWTEGLLTREILKDYACQYYHFVKEFPRMVSAVHSNIPDLSVREPLLLNLMDEEMGSENHPALWMRFATAMGAHRHEVETTEPLTETARLVNTMMNFCRHHTFQEGVASLYAYESQIPEVSRVKIEGLKKFYGITDPDEVKFFTVHQEADVLHSQAERDMITANTDDELRPAVVNAATDTAEALWGFLDGIQREFVTPRGVHC